MAWFFTPGKEDSILITNMVTGLKREIIPELTVKRPESLSVNKTTRVLDRLIRQFQEHNQTRHLGYIARVRFFHHFQWTLRDSGYSKEFVALIMESLLSGVVARKPADKR